MPTGQCLNDTCGHEWTLRKHPSEYSSEISCPDCGSTRVDISVPDQSPPNAESAQPVPAEPAQQSDDQELATPGQMSSAMQDFGSTAAEMETAPPEKQAQFKGAVMGMIGDALKGYGQQVIQEKAEGSQRSKQHGGKIKPANDYAECAECGGQIVDLPAKGQEFVCPHCRTVLRV